MTVDPSVELRLLGLPGLFRRQTDGSMQRVLGPGKPLLLLARLALNPEGMAREELAAFLWPDMPEERARASARQALHMLRQQLGQEAILADRYRVRLAQSVQADVTTFRAAIAAGDDALAVTAYGGPFMQDHTIPDASAADEWLSLERRRLARLFERAARRQVALLRDGGQMAAALTLAGRVCDSAPTDPLHWQQLFELLEEAGDETRLLREVDALRLQLTTERWEGLPEKREAERLIERFDAGPAVSDRDNADSTGTGDLLRQNRLRFVGRRAELALLMQAWSNAANVRRGGRMLVAGQAGIGKTRLLEEFIRRPRSDGATIVWVRARRGGRDDRLGFAVDLIEALTAQPGSIGISQESATVLVALVPTLTTLFPGAVWHEAPSDALPVQVAALRDLVTTLTEERPLMLVLDDLQWADASSLALIDQATRTLDGMSVLLVATTRPRQIGSLDQWPRLELLPLGREQVEALLRTTERADLDPAVLDAIMDATGGSPLHAIPALRLLMSTGKVTESDGQLRLTAAYAEDPSISMRDLIAASVRDLPSAAMKVLSFLALLDAPAPPARLQRLLSDPSALDAILNALDDADLVLRTDGAWRIAHDSLADAVLHAIDPTVRRELALEIAAESAATAVGYVEMRRAIRFFLDADAPDGMIAAVEAWHARSANPLRGAALADLLLGPGIAPAIRARLIRAFPVRARRTLPLLTAVLVTAACMWGMLIYWAKQPAQLVLINVPTYLAHAGIPPLLEVHDRVGRLSRALDGQRVRATIVGGSDSIIGTLSTPIVDGTVALDSLRVVEPTSLTSQARPAVLELTTDGVAPTRIELFRRNRDSLWLEAGVLAGQPLDPVRPTVRVTPGDSISGWVRVRYTSSHAAILIMMNQFSTWMPPQTDTVSVASLLTPAERAFLSIPHVAYRAPQKRGSYWLVWTFTSEPAAVWIASSTSWRCGTPVWDDGNEKAQAADSTLRRGWGTGATLAFQKLLCDPDKPRMYETGAVPFMAIKVAVE